MKLIGSINHWRFDPAGWIGSAIMLSFAGIAAWRWQNSSLIFFALLFLRDASAAWFLISRNPDQSKKQVGWVDVLAYVSCGSVFLYLNQSQPLFVHAETVSSVLAIVGFAISTIALFEIGASFGVSPANRGLVKTGIYRFVKHPMYLGYGIAEIGLVFLNPLNGLIFVFSVGLYLARIHFENTALKINV